MFVMRLVFGACSCAFSIVEHTIIMQEIRHFLIFILMVEW